jgi:hypothetical protein
MPTGWGFALQRGTVRFLGTCLADPTGVPMAAIAYDHELAVAGRTSLPRSVQRLELNGETRREASWPPPHQGSSSDEASPTLVWGLTAIAVVAMGARSSALTAEPSPAAGGANRAERPDAIQVRA